MGNEFKSISSQDGSCSVDVGEYAGDYKIRFKVGGVERGTIDDTGLFEIDNIKCRGTIQTVAYEVNTVSAMGGSLAVAGGDALAADMTALDSATMTILGNDTFSVNDRLVINNGVSCEYFIVTDASSAPTYVVTRDAAGVFGVDANPAWTRGATVVNFGAPDEGVVWLTASENNAPFVSIWTHAGSPWSDAVERCRFGNLNGYLGYSSDIYGVGIGSIATNEASLTFDPTNGIRIRQGATVVMALDMSGNSTLSGFTVGAPSESEEGLYAGTGATRVQMKAGVGIWTGATLFADAKIGLSNDGSGKIASGNFIWDTSGNVTMTGSFTSSATITGGTLQTAASGARSVLSSAGFAIYDSTAQRAKIGSDGAGWFGASDKIAWTSLGVLTAGGWTISSNALTGTNAILKSGGVLSLGTGTDSYLTNNRIYVDGPNNKMSVGTTFKVENGVITATSGTIGGWLLGSVLLQSASSGARIVLDQSKLRISIFDAANEKVVMGYLDDLVRNNGSGTATSGATLTLTDTSKDWGTNEHSSLEVHITGGTGSGQTRTISSNTATILTISASWATIPDNTSTYEIRYTVADYGFWAKAGDTLNIDGDVLYSSGDWIIQHDSSYLVQDGSGNTIIRLGTDTGEKGLFVYDINGNYLAKLISTGLKMYGNGQQRVEIANDGTGWIGTNSGITWDASGNISISGTMTIGAGSSYTGNSISTTYTDATTGATWGSNISGQPADALLLNELNGVGAYQQVALPYIEKPCTIDCFIDNHSATACWFKVAEFTLDGNYESCSFNGLFCHGGSTGRFSNQMRVMIELAKDNVGNISSEHYKYSGVNLTNYLKVKYVGNVVTFYAYLPAWEGCLFNGVWVCFCTLSQTWIFSEQTSSDNIGTATPTGTDVSPTPNYELNADITSTHTAANAAAYTGAAIATGYTAAKCTDALADQTSTHTANNTSNVGTIAASSVQGWAHASDTTTIDGGKIYTNTITASQIAANAITTSELAANSVTSSHIVAGTIVASDIAANTITASELKGTAFGTLTITSGKIAINTTDALEIQASGNMKILAGGDIEMLSASGNFSKIKLYGTTGSHIGDIFAFGSTTCGWYTQESSRSLQLGATNYKWDTVGITANTVQLLGYYDADDMATINLVSGNNNSYMSFFNERAGIERTIIYNGWYFSPSTNKTIDLGTSSAAWDDAYADDWHNVADFYHFDNHDDLAAINQIKGSGEFQEYNRHELIDDDTLPLWLLSKHKKDGKDINEETQEIIKAWKKGDVIYNPDDKPYLSLKTCISLAWGAIRQLDKKIDKLNGGAI